MAKNQAPVLAQTIEHSLANAGDAEIADAARALTRQALVEAAYLLEYGCYKEKMPIITLFASQAAKLIGAETSTQYDVIRDDLTGIMSEMRGTAAPIVDALEVSTIEDDGPELAARAPVVPSDDPDESPHD